MRGVENEEAENAGGKRERELYPPPLLVVQNEEMRQRGVRDREIGREREMGTDKGSKQRDIHMRNRQRKSSPAGGLYVIIPSQTSNYQIQQKH